MLTEKSPLLHIERPVAIVLDILHLDIKGVAQCHWCQRILEENNRLRQRTRVDNLVLDECLQGDEALAGANYTGAEFD